MPRKNLNYEIQVGAGLIILIHLNHFLLLQHCRIDPPNELTFRASLGQTVLDTPPCVTILGTLQLSLIHI